MRKNFNLCQEYISTTNYRFLRVFAYCHHTPDTQTIKKFPTYMPYFLRSWRGIHICFVFVIIRLLKRKGEKEQKQCEQSRQKEERNTACSLVWYKSYPRVCLQGRDIALSRTLK